MNDGEEGVRSGRKGETEEESRPFFRVCVSESHPRTLSSLVLSLA